MNHRKAAIAAAAIALSAVTVATANASGGSLYWSSNSNNKIGKAALDGSGATTFRSGITGPFGTTINPAAGTLLFASYNGASSALGSTLLDGSGSPQNLALPAGSVNDPYGVVFAPSTGRVYWANYGAYPNDKIRYATADGSSSGILYQASALPAGVIDGPLGVAPDPASGRIYWMNYTNPTIGYANLDGSGGGGVITPQNTGASPCASAGTPYNLIVDSAAGKLYLDSEPIQRMNLDGSGCEVLATGNTGGGTTAGMALDKEANRLYFGTALGNEVRYIDLADGSNHQFNTTGFTNSYTDYPVLHTAPVVKPSITGDAVTGATLTCAAGVADDVPGVNLYRSATTATTFAWKRDGAEVAGATSATHVPAQAGSYTCSATAGNVEGTTTGTSSAISVVVAPTPGGSSGGTGTPAMPTTDAVRIPTAQAKAGLQVSAGGDVKLPLSCPSGLPGNCDASGQLSTTLPAALQAERSPFAIGQQAQAKKEKVLASFKGVEIATGTTRLYTVRINPTTYTVLRAKGIRRVPATLRTVNALAGTGTPITSSQRIWLKILPRKVAVAG